MQHFGGELGNLTLRLLETLIISPPFGDDIQRIAFAAADVFLRINGGRQ